MTREQQQRTKIKICGLKRPEDITYVNEQNLITVDLHRISEEQQKCYRCIGERTYCKT